MRALPLALVLATACSAAHPGGVDFSVRGGFSGNGDGTPATHVDPDGTVTRELPGGTTTIMLAPEATAELYAKLRGAEFGSLEPRYDECCDAYVYVVTVELDGMPRSVEASSLAKIPDRLAVVINALKEIAHRE